MEEFSEEREARERSAEVDYELYHKTCDEVAKIFKRHFESRKKGSKKNPSHVQEVDKLKADFSMLFLTMKKLNRLDKFRTAQSRDDAVNAKQKVDTFYLQLQNLLYEVLYLEKEVTKCLQFRSGDQDVQLVPMDQFLKDGLEFLAPGGVNSDPHLVHLARLEHEKTLRQQQAAESNKRETEKAELLKRINRKRQQLAKLRPQLKTILASTKTLQEFFELPLDEDRTELGLAKHLPEPLFILFSEVKAYAKVFDLSLKVNISGTIEEVKEFESRKAREDAEDGDEDEETDKSNRKKSDAKKTVDAKSTSEGLRLEREKWEKLLGIHPLSVVVDCHIMGHKNSKVGRAQLTFKYMDQLEATVVVSQCTLEEGEMKTLSGKEALQSENIFAHLIEPYDSGESLPSPGFSYRLQRLGLDEFPNAQVGSVYLWAQDLCGLYYPSCQSDEKGSDLLQPVKVDKAICQSKVSAVLHEIRERFLSRLALQRQLCELTEACKSSREFQIVPELRSKFPPRILPRLESWEEITFEEYISLPITSVFREHGTVTDNDDFFKARIIRNHQSSRNSKDPASLTAFISLKPSYPRDPPVFCLLFEWQNGSYSARNSERIRALEFEVNTRFLQLAVDGSLRKEFGVEDGHFQILSMQILHLMASTDALVDSWNFDSANQTGSIRESRDVLYLRPTRGKQRLPPLKYQPETQMFSQ